MCMSEVRLVTSFVAAVAGGIGGGGVGSGGGVSVACFSAGRCTT